MALLLRVPALSYAALTVAVVLVTALLRGYPVYSDGFASLESAIFWSTVLALGIWLQWRPAWYLAIVLDVLWLIVTATVALVQLDPKSLLVAVLQAGIVRVLLSRELDDGMWHRAGAPA